MINREDMLELTRRMTPKRTCFDRVAGAYIDETGLVDDTFNIHFGKLLESEKTRNLNLAKNILQSRTNEQLKEYQFESHAKGKNSMWMLLNIMRECGLKNDAVMDIFYEQMADAYPADHEIAVYVFHGVYDIPLKGEDKEQLWESEEVYDFILCIVSDVMEEYTLDKPSLGFLYPAFSDRSAEKDKIQIYHQNPENIEEGFLYKLFGKQEV